MYQGFLRLVLALSVVYAHYLPNVGHIGKYAVICFFMISGFLITRVICNGYNYGGLGLLNFSLNRILRIYPAYIIIIFLGYLVLSAYPQAAFFVNENLYLPTNNDGWLKNITILGLIDFSGSRYFPSIIPVAWSLNIELFFYFLIAIWIGRTKFIAVAWFVCSLIFIIYSIFELNLKMVYFSYEGASLSFATGAVIHHFWDDITKPMKGTSPVIQFSLAIGSIILVIFYAFALEPIGIYYYLKGMPLPEIQEALQSTNVLALYGILPLSALAVVLTTFPTITNNTRIIKLDTLSKLSGALSYPIFLSHTIVLVFVYGAFGTKNFQGIVGSAKAGLFALIIVIILSLLIHYLVEGPISHIRDRVRYRDIPKT